MVKGELKSLRITLEATDSGVLGYVYLREIDRGAAAKTEDMGQGIMADYDAQGELLGVEFLDAARVDSTTMRALAARLKVPELAGIDLAEMCKTPA